MTRINTNVSSLVAQNTLGRSHAALEQSLTRLSTGLRINTGKDDPAGLIASENLRSDITSITKAISNTDRANEVIATADSAPLTVTIYNRGRATVQADPSYMVQCQRGRSSPGGGMRSGESPVLWSDSTATILPDSSRTWRGFECAESERPVDGPYWLSPPRRGDMFAKASLLESEHDATHGAVVRVRLTAGGTPGYPVELDAPVVYRYADPVRGDVSRPLAFVPELSVSLDRAVEYAPARTPLVRQLRVEVRSAGSGCTGASPSKPRRSHVRRTMAPRSRRCR